jgi:hypothetical protein
MTGHARHSAWTARIEAGRVNRHNAAQMMWDKTQKRASGQNFRGRPAQHDNGNAALT